MMHSKRLSNKLSNKKFLLRAMALFSLIGFADTTYLTASHYLGVGIKCVILKGCDVVLLSKYSEILGVPVALIGLFFYIGVFILVNMAEIYDNVLFPKLLVTAGALGFTASLIFLYLQVFVIKALCIYCLTSAVSSTMIFILAIIAAKNISKPDQIVGL